MSGTGSVARKGRPSQRGKPLSREALKSEVLSWAKRIGVTAKEVHIRPMKRKWASCSTSGRFSFNEELLLEPAKFRNEVIVHELLHLKVPNHGKLFKALFQAHMSGHQSLT